MAPRETDGVPVGPTVCAVPGRGVMPLTFEALKSQRYRWCLGGIQILRMHCRAARRALGRARPAAERVDRCQPDDAGPTESAPTTTVPPTTSPGRATTTP